MISMRNAFQIKLDFLFLSKKFDLNEKELK